MDELTLRVDLDALTIDDLALLDDAVRGKVPLSERIALYKRIIPGCGDLPPRMLPKVAAAVVKAIQAAMNPEDGTGKNSMPGSGTISSPEPGPSQ